MIEFDGIFLEKMALVVGFNNIWVSKIMTCVTTVQYSILHNGCDIGMVTPL